MKIPLAEIEFCACCGYIKSQCKCEKKQTNADRIRSMSDGELAELFAEKCHISYEFAICWLKSEVKEL